MVQTSCMKLIKLIPHIYKNLHQPEYHSIHPEGRPINGTNNCIYQSHYMLLQYWNPCTTFELYLHKQINRIRYICHFIWPKQGLSSWISKYSSQHHVSYLTTRHGEWCQHKDRCDSHNHNFLASHGEHVEWVLVYLTMYLYDKKDWVLIYLMMCTCPNQCFIIIPNRFSSGCSFTSKIVIIC